MPEGKKHLYFCGKRRWNIRPCLYDGGCPLDNRRRFIAGENWHSFHNRIADESLPTIEGTPTIEGCLIWARSVLEKMAPHFAVFQSQLPGVESGPCWTAHLAADLAYKYWYRATGETRFIADLPGEHPFWRFVEDVGKRMLQPDK
jgi:hypothetical protein